jgi:hypothetical protein
MTVSRSHQTHLTNPGDNSFILGGSTNSTFDLEHADDDGYLNVFTLSIPAFRWFKSADSDQVRRADHSCQVIGNRQMLVIGGTQPSNPLGIAAVDPNVVRDYYTYR